MFRNLLHGMPTKPVVYLAPILMVLVLSWYYFDRYQDCSAHASVREALYRGAASSVGTIFKMSEVTPYTWTRVLLAPGYSLDGEPDCPFSWDWPSGMREQLAAADRLGIIVFVNELVDKGGVVLTDYVEYDTARVHFRTLGKRAMIPSQATFWVYPSSNGLILEPTQAGKQLSSPRLDN